MLRVQQIHIGSNMVADGSFMLEEAAGREGFIKETAYSAIEIDNAIKKLRSAADKLEAVRRSLVANGNASVNMLIAAE